LATKHTIIAQARNPDRNRLAVVTSARWHEHVLRSHPEMDGHLEAVKDTIRQPDLIQQDEHPDRTRYFRRGVGPDRWLRVVVEFAGHRDQLVTAFGQENDP
jgi:hypothetical protein